MTDPTLLADIDAALAWLAPFRCGYEDMRDVLLRCRAALIVHEGEWAEYQAPYVDREGDAMSDDDALCRAAKTGRGWAHD